MKIKIFFLLSNILIFHYLHCAENTEQKITHEANLAYKRKLLNDAIQNKCLHIVSQITKDDDLKHIINNSELSICPIRYAILNATKYFSHRIEPDEDYVPIIKILLEAGFQINNLIDVTGNQIDKALTFYLARITDLYYGFMDQSLINDDPYIKLFIKHNADLEDALNYCAKHGLDKFIKAMIIHRAHNFITYKTILNCLIEAQNPNNRYFRSRFKRTLILLLRFCEISTLKEFIAHIDLHEKKIILSNTQIIINERWFHILHNWIREKMIDLINENSQQNNVYDALIERESRF